MKIVSKATAIRTQGINDNDKNCTNRLIVTELKKQRQPRLPSVVSSTSSEASASATSWTRQQQQPITVGKQHHLIRCHYPITSIICTSITMFINIRVDDCGILDPHQHPPSGSGAGAGAGAATVVVIVVASC